MSVHAAAARATRLPGRFALPAALAIAAVAVGFALIALPYITLSPDARYSLAWGAELARGSAPDLSPGDLPTPHPLPVAAGALLSLAGPERAADGYSLVAAIAFLVLLYAAFRLGRTLGGSGKGGVAAGALCALLVGIAPRVDFFAAHGFVDIPFAALAVLAAALVAEGPRRNATAALALLAAAGLLRPEAWALSALYLAWLLVPRGGAHGAPAWRAAALAASAPAIWAAFDLVLAGDPLHSLTSTRAHALALGRPAGLGELPAALEAGLPGLVGWPAVAAGAAMAGWWGRRALRSRVRAGAPAPLPPRERAFAVAAILVVGGVAAFGALALAGLPLNDRYLIVPGIGLVALASAALTAAARGRRGAVPAAALAVLAIGSLISLPGDLRETGDMLSLARDKHAADADIERLLARRDVRARIAACPRLVASGSGRAATAALLRRDPAEVSISRHPLPPPGTAALSTADTVPARIPATRVGAWAFLSNC